MTSEKSLDMDELEDKSLEELEELVEKMQQKLIEHVEEQTKPDYCPHCGEKI